MGNDVAVKRLFGEKVLRYLKQKHRGGTNSAKGNVFEHYFAVYQVASLVPTCLLSDSEVRVETQQQDFVDDIVVSDFHMSTKEHFQLKNSASVSWTAGNHSIKDDFQMQKLLNDHLCIRSTSTTLVCSDPIQANFLEKQIPTEISNHSKVEHFSYAETLNAAIQLEPKLANAIKNLCAFADIDKLERLGTLILGVWVANSGQISRVSELWERVLLCEPNYVKSPIELSIPVTLDKILMQIDGFSYTIDHGYFVWCAPSWHMEGKFPYPINSDQFIELSSKIVELSPTKIEELEDLLV